MQFYLPEHKTASNFVGFPSCAVSSTSLLHARSAGCKTLLSPDVSTFIYRGSKQRLTTESLYVIMSEEEGKAHELKPFHFLSPLFLYSIFSFCSFLFRFLLKFLHNQTWQLKGFCSHHTFQILTAA